jgi:two-component system chemotaxis response regulator CheY
MKTLIVEDDFFSRLMLKEILSPFGDCDYAMNGKEAIAAFDMALTKAPYDLICMDIMMPEMDGQEALTMIRRIENEHQIQGANEVKVIMTTALADPKSVIKAYYHGGATAYLVKPINKDQLLAEIKSFGLI